MSRMQHMETGGLSFARYGQGQVNRRPIMHGEVDGPGPIEAPASPSTSLDALKEGAGQALAAWRGIEQKHGIVESPFPSKGTGTPDRIEEMVQTAPVSVPATAGRPQYGDGTAIQMGDVIVYEGSLYEVKGRDVDGNVFITGPGGVGSQSVPTTAMTQCRVLKRKA